MFDKPYEEQLAFWSDFRNHLEQSKSPFQDVIDFYSKVPLVSLNTDPWDRSRWPSPWELLQENQYCEFCRVLGYCFSLQLTERFKDSTFEIHISTDDEIGYQYLLVIDQNWVLGYDEDSVVSYDKFLQHSNSQLVYNMSNTE